MSEAATSSEAKGEAGKGEGGETQEAKILNEAKSKLGDIPKEAEAHAMQYIKDAKLLERVKEGNVEKGIKETIIRIIVEIVLEKIEKWIKEWKEARAEKEKINEQSDYSKEINNHGSRQLKRIISH